MLVDPTYGTKPMRYLFLSRTSKNLITHLRRKKRLMAKGYAHKEGIDYEENVSPIEKWGTILTLLDLATHNG